MFCIYIICNKDGEPKKKKKLFFCQIGNFLSGIGVKTYFLTLGMGPNFGHKSNDREPCCYMLELPLIASEAIPTFTNK